MYFFIKSKVLKIFLIVIFSLIMLTGCVNKKSYVYEGDSIESLELKEMTSNGWVTLSQIAEEEKSSFLTDLSKIEFKKDRAGRKEAPELVIAITFKDSSYHQISYFCLEEFTNNGGLERRQNYVCSRDVFLDLINKYKG